MTNNPAVVAEGVVKRYGDLVAVDHVDLRVEQGEVHGLLGPNGAGKTTLMRILFGLIHPDEGDLQVFGQSVSHHGVAALQDVGGFIESPRFYPYLTGRRNLELLARMDMDSGSLDRIDAVLEQAGLGGRGGDKVRGYSFGMQQRLGIAASLLRAPRLLVVDEPSNGLDPGGIRDMRRLILDLAASGLTILVSSHNMLEVEELCDHVTIMRRGQVAFHGSMTELHAQAPVPMRRLRTSDDHRAVPELKRISGISDVRVDDDGIVLSGNDEAMGSATIQLGVAGIGITSLAATEAPLESLFFVLTETPRDDVHLEVAA
jgi:ABC-2 type transport system ATP-binding protein